MVLKVITVLVGAFLLLQSMGWILDPSAAAAGLGMTIVEGVGANTQIGDRRFYFFLFYCWIICCIGRDKRTTSVAIWFNKFTGKRSDI